ncbi:unnamed protein product, partial [Rotaria magnacalcarata]
METLIADVAKLVSVDGPDESSILEITDATAAAVATVVVEDIIA